LHTFLAFYLSVSWTGIELAVPSSNQISPLRLKAKIRKIVLFANR